MHAPIRSLFRHVAALSLLLAGALGCGEEGGEMGLTDVQPRRGSMSGEQPVQIKGFNFRTDIGYTVYFGNLRATSVTIIDPETLLVLTPQREEPGVVDVTILADSGPAWKIGQVFTFETAEAAAGATGGAGASKMGNLAF